MRCLKIAAIFICIACFLVACSKDKGFKESKSTTTTTLPSSTPTLKQPCSLMSVDKAAKTLNISAKKIDHPESSGARHTLRCKYAAISDDEKLYLTLNIYIYATQDAFDQVRHDNQASSIESNVDEAFSYTTQNSRQAERLVAARQGNKRIGVSASIAVINSQDKLSNSQITLPSNNDLAVQVGLLLASV
jgi:hypothetical protein